MSSTTLDLTRRGLLLGSGALLVQEAQSAVAGPVVPARFSQVELVGHRLFLRPFQKSACRCTGRVQFADEGDCGRPGGRMEVRARRSRSLTKPVVVSLSIPGTIFGLVVDRDAWSARSRWPFALMIDGVSADLSDQGLQSGEVAGLPGAMAFSFGLTMPPGLHAMELVFACSPNEDRAWRLHGWLSDSAEPAAGERPCP